MEVDAQPTPWQQVIDKKVLNLFLRKRPWQEPMVLKWEISYQSEKLSKEILPVFECGIFCAPSCFKVGRFIVASTVCMKEGLPYFGIRSNTAPTGKFKHQYCLHLFLVFIRIVQFQKISIPPPRREFHIGPPTPSDFPFWGSSGSPPTPLEFPKNFLPPPIPPGNIFFSRSKQQTRGTCDFVACIFERWRTRAR